MLLRILHVHIAIQFLIRFLRTGISLFVLVLKLLIESSLLTVNTWRPILLMT